MLCRAGSTPRLATLEVLRSLLFADPRRRALFPPPRTQRDAVGSARGVDGHHVRHLQLDIPLRRCSRRSEWTTSPQPAQMSVAVLLCAGDLEIQHERQASSHKQACLEHASRRTFWFAAKGVDGREHRRPVLGTHAGVRTERRRSLPRAEAHAPSHARNAHTRSPAAARLQKAPTRSASRGAPRQTAQRGSPRAWPALPGRLCLGWVHPGPPPGRRRPRGR